MRRTLRAAWVLLALVPGCGLSLDLDPPDDPPVALDASFDAGPLDAGSLDAGSLDAGDRDGSAHDASGPDAGALDADVLDADVLDADVLDADVPDGGTSSACGNGVPDVGELCDDGNTTPGDGCEPSCRPTCTSHLGCVAPDPCSAGICVAGFGCSSSPLDADGDGFAIAVGGICGDDCDDGDAAIHPGAPERCDGVDQSCDGRVDEGVLSACLRDLDGDGWGSAFEACVCPPPPPNGGGDCQDIAGNSFSRLIRPGQPVTFTEPYTRIDGTTSFDFDCDGAPEPTFDQVFVACTHDGFGCRGGGWTGVVAPCGARTDFVFCTPGSVPGTCEETAGMQTQACN